MPAVLSPFGLKRHLSEWLQQRLVLQHFGRWNSALFDLGAIEPTLALADRAPGAPFEVSD